MKKIISSLFVFLLVFSFGILNVSADNLNPNHISSLSVYYQYDSIQLKDTRISLYQLAHIDEMGNYSFTNDYQDIVFDFSNMSSSDLGLQAEKILDYIHKNQKRPMSVLTTNSNGMVTFSDLIPGMYFVSVESREMDNYRYYASPMILSVPVIENDSYQYDVSAFIKTEREKIMQEVTPPKNTVEEVVPNTMDNIYIYVVLMIVSIFIIFGVLLYILKEKGEKKDENKK